MSRWTYLIPRLIILGLTALVIWLSIDPLLSRALVHHAQATTGAKVEIGQLRSTLGKGKIFLQDVQIADPRDPSTNAFQADMAYLDIDVAALLRKKIVITGGRSSDVRFGSPRTDAGCLDEGTAELVNDASKEADQPTTQSTEPADLTAEATARVDRAVATVEQHWLDQLQGQITSENENTFLVSQVAAETAAPWPARLKDTRSQLLKIDEQVEELRGSLETDNSNPLRQDYRSALANVSSLIVKAKQLQQKLQTLRETSAADLQRLTEVRHGDLQGIEDLASTRNFDSQTISQLLLTRSQQAHVDNIMHWFTWFRSSVPDFEADLRTTPARGQHVYMTGRPGEEPGTPDFLVKELNLEGAGHFAGQYLNFAGKLRDFTLHPDRHDQPISFELRAQGKQHLVIQCEIDRRTNAASDRLEIACPDLEIEATPLGTDQSMLVTVGPQLKMQADIQLRANGEAIDGLLIFRHSNVSLHVDQLHALAGGVEMAARLNQELATCDQFETRIRLTGPMTNYSTEITSDLGDKVAAAMTRANQQMVESRLAERRQNLNAIAESHIQGLTTQVGSAISNQSERLTATQQWLTRTREQISSVAKKQWPDIR